MITKNLEIFNKPLSKKEYDVLLTNFYHTEYRVDPEYLKNKYGLNNEEIKSPPVREPPKHFNDIHKKMIEISRLVEVTNIPKRRLSHNFAQDLVKKTSDLEEYKIHLLSKQKFLIQTVLQLALEVRAQIHHSKLIILLERKCDFVQSLYKMERLMNISPKISFVIFYDKLLKGYQVRAIRKEENEEYRRLLKKEFWGKSQEELEQLTGLQDFVKCSKEGTFAITLSLFSAV